MKLIGLDFETANYKTGSICAAGLALVEDGELSDSRSWLIRPHENLNWVEPYLYKIHGISSADICDAPEFTDIYQEFCEFISQGDVVVIHNSNFDITQLKSVIYLYGLEKIDFNYACSLRMSRRMLPELSSHRLSDVAAHFSYNFKHHDALEDAITCAKIAYQLGNIDKFKKKF